MLKVDYYQGALGYERKFYLVLVPVFTFSKPSFYN